LYDEHLIHQETFLRWIVGQLESSNPAQLPFVLLIAEDFLPEFVPSEPLSARLVAAALARLNQVSRPTHLSN